RANLIAGYEETSMQAVRVPSTIDTETLVDNEVLNSPFGAAVFAREQENGRGDFFEALSGPLESPFAEAMAVGDETSRESLAFEAVLGEIQSESFDEAVQGLVDEAAARHL